ncbi:MAG TPA: cytochrome c nitrite reductase small subunit [Armatimonadota bacterium]|jgi:cytochrome c nitrite reductase small subunit|nr:cytochrome c nitrite reductase small subunit [Armatimonadota bacterium]HOM71897.1 cytochrome c nitrite reductase small subunit [Armatimonadota bacterium]
MKLAGAAKIFLCVSLGAFIGASAFTFWYARGYSYLLDDPDVCINCHIMRDNYNSWRVSSHKFATCNDCHIPHDFVSKWAIKGENGFWHSWVFTFGPPDVIQIREHNRVVLNENCIHCHETMVNHLTITHDPDRKCMDCHKGVGHGM